VVGGWELVFLSIRGLRGFLVPGRKTLCERSDDPDTYFLPFSFFAFFDGVGSWYASRRSARGDGFAVEGAGAPY